jgi:hypothetical protein
MEKLKEKKSPEDQCIIHQTVSDEDEHLVSPQSYNSWLTLLEAAKVRNHAPVLDIAKELADQEVPKIFYHRKCRSLFTVKRDLETLKRKQQQELVMRLVPVAVHQNDHPGNHHQNQGYLIRSAYSVVK